MNHLLDIQSLSSSTIMALIERALYFKNTGDYPRYPQSTLANLFYENSTRTRVSFELAAQRLGVSVVNLDLASSSEKKGETIEDTLKTLMAMGIDLFAIRHHQNGLPNQLASLCLEGVHLINAGDGQHAHPSQALLDMMTIFEQKPDFSRLKIAIVGNLRHSRVANSMQQICAKLNVGELTLVSPSIWSPEVTHYGRITSSLADGIKNADVILCLRVQLERLKPHEKLDLVDYHQDYAINLAHLKWAKSNVMVMHPGPINRGVELDSEVADGSQSCILRQVSNGVFMRMAILDALISSKDIFPMPLEII